MAATQPWSGCASGVPFWETLPDAVGQALKEDYEERAAMFEICGGYSRGFAQAHAYSLFFTDRRHELSPFVEESEIQRQELISWICNKHVARMEENGRALR